MPYRIDLNVNPVVLVPCTFVPSTVDPSKTLSVNEDGSSIVVEPDGSQVRTMPAGDPNFDSAYTQGTLLSGLLVYRSASGDNLGVPRAYKVIQ